MGNSESSHKAPGCAAIRYGGVGSSKCLGGYFVLSSQETVIIINQTSIENYNPESGDRRMRLILSDSAVISAASYLPRTCFGHVFAFGNLEGVVNVLDEEFVSRKHIALSDMYLDNSSTANANETEIELPASTVNSFASNYKQISITHVSLHPHDMLIVGDNNGCLRLYNLLSGDARVTINLMSFEHLFDLDALGEADHITSLSSISNMSIVSSIRKMAVVSAVIITTPKSTSHANDGNESMNYVAIAASGGLVALFSIPSITALQSLTEDAVTNPEIMLALYTQSGILQLYHVAMEPDSTVCDGVHNEVNGFLLTVHAYTHTIWMISLSNSNNLVLDYQDQLRAFGDAYSHTTAACYIHTERVLCTGLSSGVVYVWKVLLSKSTASETNDYEAELVLLKRIASSKDKHLGITSLVYDVDHDVFVIGDVNGAASVWKTFLRRISATPQDTHEASKGQSSSTGVLSPVLHQTALNSDYIQL